MARTSGLEQYVLLPTRGLRAEESSTAPEARQFLMGAEGAEGAGGEAPRPLDGGRGTMRVLDSIGPAGAKLVELAPEAALSLRARYPGLRLVPVVHYTPAQARRALVEEDQPPPPEAPEAQTVMVQVVSQRGRAPVVGAYVVGYVDLAAGLGVQGVTDADGWVELTLDAATVRFERVYVYPVSAYWTLRKTNVRVAPEIQLRLQPLDLAYKDALRTFYPSASSSAGTGVTVGVVDTGVGPHPDLVVAGGANTTMHEDPRSFEDNGLGHGTHLAGVIAARGRPPRGIRGVAPGVTLRSYRVYPEGMGSAANFDVAKGIDQAAADGCDLLMLGMNGGAPDEVLRAAVESARDQGALCIMGAGNAFRSAVTFPASNEMVMAVTALGRKGTFPPSTTAADDVAAPPGKDRNDFIAAFSNVGPAVDLTGPGVAIISTYPDGYAEISGTSMACAAVTGAAARVLAKSPVLEMPRDGARAEALVRALLASARTLGFPPALEGHGMPRAR
jgi:subtilisin